MLLKMSVTGGLMIAAITAVRALLQHRLDRRVFLLLWAITALRLLLPVFIPSALMPSRQLIAPITQEPVTVIVHQPSAESTVSSEIVSAAQETITIETRTSGQTTVLRVLWLSGAFLLAAVFCISHLRNRWKYRFSLPLPSHVKVPEGLRVRMLDGLEAPLTYGIFRSTVLLPCDLSRYSEEQLRHILLHEQAHIRHHDVLKKLFLLFTLCVHWFNPAVWAMFYLASQDMEIRCDAEVISTIGKSARLSYARTLVAAEHSRLSGILQTGFSFSSTAERLKAISKGKTSRVLSIMTAIVFIPIFLFGFLTMQAAASVPPAVTTSPPISGAVEPSHPSTEAPTLSTAAVTEPTESTPQMSETEETTSETTFETTVEMPLATTVETTAETVAETDTSAENAAPPFSAWTDSASQPVRIAFLQSKDILVYTSADCTFYSDSPNVVAIDYYLQWDGQNYPHVYTVSLRSVNTGEPANIYACYQGEYYYLCSASPVAGTSRTSYGPGYDWHPQSSYSPTAALGIPIIDLETGYVAFP